MTMKIPVGALLTTVALSIYCSPKMINWKLDETRSEAVEEENVNVWDCNSNHRDYTIIGEVWGWDDDREWLIKRAKKTAGKFGWEEICVDKLEWVNTGTQTIGQVRNNGSFYSNTYNVGTYYIHALVLKNPHEKY
jgi:hypothetical protein